LKSASYLLRRSEFSTVRNFMLDHSATILQDDTGIPVSYFDRMKWQLQPFGRYVEPLKIFPGAYQPLLADLYRKDHPLPLDFGLGYHWRVNESGLLLAKRVPEGKPD
jgi:hypothetical protein